MEGYPIAQLLLHHNATVTICHAKTENLSEVTREAEILVVATGHPHLVPINLFLSGLFLSQQIGAKDVKEGAVVIDVGITTVDEDVRYQIRNSVTDTSNLRIVGDVDYDDVYQVYCILATHTSISSYAENLQDYSRPWWCRSHDRIHALAEYLLSR